MALTPQEQEVAFQQQALENGQAVLTDLQSSLAIAQAEGASADEIAGLQAAINNQIRVNGFTAENLAEAQTKVTVAETTTANNDAELAAETAQTGNPSIQVFDDGSTLQTFEDGSTLATAPDGTTSSTDAPADVVTTQEDPTNGPVNPIGTAYDDDGNLNPGWELDENNNPVYVGTGIDASAQTGSETSDETSSNSDSGDTRAGVARGATPSRSPGAQAQWSEAKDLRVKLRVPNEYLKGPSAGPASILQKNGGILFPYTPTISMENQAQYASQSPLHSNYAQYFYKNSAVSPINITAKFTVQNEFEGAVLLGVIHLLRSLTKMKWGNDPDAGSPPPICRFDAYGDYMMYNVPVAIASWRHELPDSVDYITVGRPGSPQTYGRTMVPVMSTINLTLNVMYSRREMLEYNVKDWLSGGLRYRGYL